MGPKCFPETSVNNYHTTPRNIPEDRRSHKLQVSVNKVVTKIFRSKKDEVSNNCRVLVTTQCIQATPSNLAQAVTLAICIQDVPGSNPGQDTEYRE